MAGADPSSMGDKRLMGNIREQACKHKVDLRLLLTLVCLYLIYVEFDFSREVTPQLIYGM